MAGFLLYVVAHAGVLIGLAVASLLNIVAMIAVGILAGITPPFGLHSSAWAVGISMGLIMPTIANVVPIRRALSSVLRDSLDLYHQVSVVWPGNCVRGTRNPRRHSICVDRRFPRSLCAC